MAVFVRDTLIGSGLFDRTERDRIKSGTGKLMKASRPCTDNALYDHLVDQVCVFYDHNPNLIPYKVKV
jgi:hypothetical protein